MNQNLYAFKSHTKMNKIFEVIILKIYNCNVNYFHASHHVFVICFLVTKGKLEEKNRVFFIYFSYKQLGNNTFYPGTRKSLKKIVT